MTDRSQHAGTTRKQPDAIWYYSRDDERVGPISSRELKSLVVAGDVTSETLIWRKGLKDWVPARKVKGLFPEETSMALAGSEVLEALERGKAMKQCPSCAEQINPDAEKCRYCGELIRLGKRASHAGSSDNRPDTRREEVPVGYAPRGAQPRAGMAVAAMVLGIVGCVGLIPLGFLGLILGIVALVKAKRRPAECGGKGMAIAGICTGSVSLIVSLFIIMSILLPSLSRSRELSKRLVCASNMRGIGTSCKIYANDNNWLFPPDLQTFVASGDISPISLVCPSSGHEPGRTTDYRYIGGLDEDAPNDWIMLYEDPANHNGEGANVVYTDGHVTFLREPHLTEELDRVRRAIEASRYGSRPLYRAHTWP